MYKDQAQFLAEVDKQAALRRNSMIDDVSAQMNAVAKDRKTSQLEVFVRRTAEVVTNGFRILKR